MTMHRAIAVTGILFLGHLSLYAQKAGKPAEEPRGKRVAILDFKNLDRNKNYDYLEATITDAVRTDLKKNFDFFELPQKEWRNLARQNYFLWPDENYTKGFALYLGALARQDIVIGGYYQAVTDSGKNKDSVVRTRVYLLDVGKQKVVSEFSVDMPADSNLFTSVEQLAARVAKEAQSVLPNKGEFKRLGITDDYELGPGSIGILAGVGLLGVPAPHSGNYSTDKPLATKDFSPIGVFATYDHRNFLLNNLRWSIMAGAQFGSQELSVAGDTKKIRSSLFDFSLAAHAGYEWRFWKIALVPLLGGGFSMASVQLDYSGLSAPPLGLDGKELEADRVNTSAPFAEAGVKMEWYIQSRLAVTVLPLYRQSFYVGESLGQVMVLGGLSLRY